ncbi:MAG: peptidoglycan DD-metalloendopeptidase family protein [Patescibacteria group bacterium]
MASIASRFGIALIAVLAMAVFVVLPVRAEENQALKEEIAKLQDEIRAKKEESAKIEEKIGTIKKSIERKQVEALSLQNQMGILEERLEAVRLDIQSTLVELETVQLELKELRLEMDEKNKQIARHKEILSELIRTIQRESDRNYLELLLSNDSFSEFFSEVQYLEEVYLDVGAQARTLRLAKEELQTKETKLSDKERSLEKLKEALAVKQQQVAEQRVYKDNLLKETKENETVFQGMLADLRRQAQTIESETQSIERKIRAKLEGSDKLPQGGDTAFSWPVPSQYITAYFHDPDYPFRNIFEHAGIDIKAGQGTAVRAAASGYVARAKRCGESWCYSYVMIIHGDGLSTVYGHLSQTAVSEDQFVARGDIIGYSGGTPGTVGAGPFVTGPHLHFETRLNGIPVNPLEYLL